MEAACSTCCPAPSRSEWLAAGQPLRRSIVPVLAEFEGWFGHDPRAEPMREALRAKARSLWAEAKTLPDPQAIARMEEALQIWPRIEGLRTDFERRRKSAKTLNIWVPSLPKTFSPALVLSDVEKQMTPLLWEGLCSPGNVGGSPRPTWLRSVPSLAESSAELLLRNDLYWSNGDAVQPADVRHSYQAWGRSDAPGRVSAERLGIRQVRLEGDRIVFDFSPNQRIPAAAWSLPLLPPQYRGRPLTRFDDPEFARQPVGTGPFRVEDDSVGEGTITLRANPYYERFAKPEEANLREVRLVHGNDLEADLAKWKPTVLYDVPTKDLETLRKKGFAMTQHLLPPAPI